MYNNETTYDKKWVTAENEAAMDELESKFFPRSYCGPSCPVAWAPEVLALLNDLDSKFGIARNTESMGGYRIQGNPWLWFCINPWRGFMIELRRQFVAKKTTKPNMRLRRFDTLNGYQRVGEVIKAGIHPIKYGFRALKTRHINPIINYILRPKITLSQIKEKYGGLTLYYNAEFPYDKYVEHEIKRTVVKLAVKGVYYPLTTLWDMKSQFTVGDEYKADTIEATPGISFDGKPTIRVKKTIYRDMIKAAGVDVYELERQAAALREPDEKDAKSK